MSAPELRKALAWLFHSTDKDERNAAAETLGAAIDELARLRAENQRLTAENAEQSRMLESAGAILGRINALVSDDFDPVDEDIADGAEKRIARLTAERDEARQSEATERAFKGRYCETLDKSLARSEELKQRATAAESEVRRLTGKNAGLVDSLKRALERERSAHAAVKLAHTSIDNVWIWHGDGYDAPGSLACPVVMSEDRLRQFVAAESALPALRERCVRLADELERTGRRMPNHACRECVPFSEILVDGFQCPYHAAIRAIPIEAKT